MQQYVPLFLSKEDLDIAVQSAYKQRNAAQIKMYRDKALKYEEEYNQVRQEPGCPQLHAPGIHVCIQFAGRWLCKPAVPKAVKRLHWSQEQLRPRPSWKWPKKKQMLWSEHHCPKLRCGSGRLLEFVRSVAQLLAVPLWLQVGSFEEVMQRMTASTGTELAAWNQVMFVAPGLLESAVRS
jgi:hypothetical protein